MLDAATATTRLTYAKSRILALLGKAEGALQRIDSQIGNCKTAVDKIALLSLKAEILHLNCRDLEAIELFNQSLDQLTVDVPEAIALSVGYNRSDVAFALLKSDDFYELGDRADVADVKLWKYEACYNATELAKAGKHYDALPILWRELHRSYTQGCWRPIRLAHQHMARECATLGWLGRATYHAIMCCNKSTQVEIGSALRLQGSPEQVDDAIKQSIAWGQLTRHFISACQILKNMADAIPDGLVAKIFEWVLPRASTTNDSLGERDALTEAWKTLGLLGHRLNKQQVAKAAHAAITHPCWSVSVEPPIVPVLRMEVLQSLRKLTQAMDKKTGKKLALETLRLLRERKQDYDYRDTMQLLCRIAMHGDKSTKAMLKRELYPSGKPLNAIELQLADAFGHEGNFARLDEACGRIATNVRLQVQRLNKGEEPKRADFTVFTVNATKDETQIVVSMIETLDIAAIFRYRSKLSQKTLRLLVDAILEVIEDPENILANKYAMIECLSWIGDVCPISLAKRIAKTLLPLARGNVIEPTITMTSREASDPLNRWKMPSGHPKEVQAIAVYALASLERDKKGSVGLKVLYELIQKLAGDSDSNVRLLTFAAARELPVLDEVTSSTVMLGTRDRDGNVARAAFSAIGGGGKKVGKAEWPLLLNAAAAALKEPDPNVRCGAAETLHRLSQKSPSSEIRQRSHDLLSTFASDRCWSVRNATGRYKAVRSENDDID